MAIDRHRSNSTSGRTIFWRLRFDWRGHEFETCSDLIAHDYMRRWRFIVPWKCLRVHHILRSDGDRHFHDHPMDFKSLVLWGGYVEHTPNAPPRVCRPGSIVRRRAEDLHYLKLLGKSAWTILVTGPFRREWGFQTEDGWIPARDYDAYLERKRANGLSVVKSEANS